MSTEEQMKEAALIFISTVVKSAVDRGLPKEEARGLGNDFIDGLKDFVETVTGSVK